MNPTRHEDMGDPNPINESVFLPRAGQENTIVATFVQPPAEPRESALNQASRTERALAGAQAGVFAGSVSLCWWMMAGLANNQSIWTLPNLMAGAVYGERSLRAEFGLFTAVGLSIHLLLCVALALVVSQLLPPGARMTRSLLSSTLAVCIWFYAWDACFWRNVAPPFALYSKQAPIFFGFLIQGLCVGLYSLFVCSPKAAKFSS